MGCEGQSSAAMKNVRNIDAKKEYQLVFIIDSDGLWKHFIYVTGIPVTEQTTELSPTVSCANPSTASSATVYKYY